MTRSRHFAKIISLMCVSACSPGQMSLSGKCSSANKLISDGSKISAGSNSQRLSLTELTTVARPVGGLLLFDLIEQQENQAVASVVSAPFSKLRFKDTAVCSVQADAAEVSGETIELDLKLSFECFGRLFYRGSNPRLQIYMKGKENQGHGYVTIPIDYPQIIERDQLLKKLEEIPGLNLIVRASILQHLFFPEVILNTRTVLSGTPVVEPDPQAIEALCLKVSEQEIASYEAQSNPQGIHPLSSSEPRPSNCQMLLQGLKHKVTVEGEFAKIEKEIVARIKEDSESHQKQAKVMLGERMDLITTLNLAHEERQTADQRVGASQLGMLLIRSANGGCVSTDEFVTSNNKAFAAFRDALKPLVEERLPDDLKAPFSSAFNHNCNLEEESFLAYDAKFFEAFDQSDLSYAKFVKALDAIQKSMKTNPTLVGVATNHIRPIDTKSFSVEYKNLSIFPGSSAPEPELALTQFSFDNPWISMTFDVTKSHPLINNLRSAYNDGYSITFGGFSVGSVAAKVEQSGGAAVTPLPSPQTVNSSGSDPFAGVQNDKDKAGNEDLNEIESSPLGNESESRSTTTVEGTPDDC